MSLTWQSWTSVSQGSTAPGAPVTAVLWEDSFALFLSDPNGGIYTIKALPGWGWVQVPGHATKPGAPITAMFSGNRFTLFMADLNGEVFTTSGIPYQSWDPWRSVSQGSTLPGAPIAAVPWENSFALFLSDPNGGIYTIKALPGWGWISVPGRSTKPGAPVTAVPWKNQISPERFLLFLADVNGEVVMTSGLPYQDWDAWTSPSQGSTTPGAAVTMAPSPAQGLNFSLFVADAGGGVYKTSPAPPPAPTGLHLIGLSAGATNNTEAQLGWNAVSAPAGSIYKIGYVITIRVASPGSGSSIVTSTTNEVFVSLSDGFTYDIFVQAFYDDSNVEVPNTRSGPSNTIVVSALSVQPHITAAITNIDTPNGPNFGLFIQGFNFGSNKQVSVTVIWTVAGEGSTAFPQGNFTTDPAGHFSEIFKGNTPYGFCPITVPFGDPQPAQNFSVTAIDLTTNKKYSTTAGPFTCPFS